MIDYVEQIKLAQEDIKFLTTLKKAVDPASCMSVSIRRGVAHDSADDEHDHERRPWRTMPFMGVVHNGKTDGMEALIDMLIADRTESLKMWQRSARDYMATLAAVLPAQTDAGAP